MATMIGLLLPFIIMFGIMYLLLIRPQNKREQKRLGVVSSLERNDKIRTFGGIIGNVTAINDDTIVIRTATSEIEILKESVANKIEM